MQCSAIKGGSGFKSDDQNTSSSLPKYHSLRMWEGFFIHFTYGYAQSPVLTQGWGTQM